MPDQLIDTPAGDARARFLFAHGAGAPMDSDFMQAISAGLSERGIEVVRFEFPYMAERRRGGSRRPPNPMPQLLDSFRAQVARFDGESLPLYIGGKSLGGRVASLLAQALFADGSVEGLVCFGYPFHPQGKPDSLRTEHLYELRCPALIVQGTRDPLGNREEVISYALPEAVRIEWLEDGDHDFKPRRASGLTQAGHWQAAVDAAATFMRSPES
ncbi:alpha/beta family hydrolase [Microbulbifer hainanensis]|uniref:alpha/beta family hydrolase n=1 Tax=Microbulbifer hainanensis TaxID=2735675 RepID=UPI0018664D73|nr:alpha/beta family hydrolase [Microbulbifer hainanensis]